MKRLLFCVAMVFCVERVSAQDIIALRNGTNVEGVTVISISESEITYKKVNKTATVPRDSAEAILYADGRYESISHVGTLVPVEDAEQTGENVNDDGYYEEFNQKGINNTDERDIAPSYNTNDYFEEDFEIINVLACGKPVMGGLCKVNHDYDGTVVEYRVVTKSDPDPEFKYLGTAPFAFLTSKEANVVSFLNKEISNFAEERPLEVPKNRDKIEFRLSKDEYEVIVKPMVKIDFGGKIILIPLNKLKK